MSGEAQVVDPEATVEVPTAVEGGTDEVAYRLVVMRRALAGQAGCWGGTVEAAVDERTELAPGWWLGSADEERVVQWAMECGRPEEGCTVWVWTTEAAAAWHVPEHWSGQLPVHPGAGWVVVLRDNP